MLLKSEIITVLLWGDRWWLPLHKLPIPFADPGQAADMLAAAWPAKSRKLRLVYHPDDFVSVAVACPNGSRAALALALADRHPELAHPGHAWGFEPIRPTSEGFCTVLHYEARPRLFALAQRLEERGFHVESAWPLPTWLSTLAPEPISGGSVFVAALHADRFASYHRGPDGAPGAHQLAGAPLAAVSSYLQGALAGNSPEYLLHLTTDDSLLASLEEQLPPAPNRQDGVFHLWDALAKPFPLPVQHPAQLLPLVPRFAPRRMASAVSLVLAGLTLWTGATWAKEHTDWRRSREAQQQQETQLREQIAGAEKVQARIAALEAEIKVLEPESRDYAGFLEELGRRRPEGVVFSDIKLEGNRVALSGWVRPGGGFDPITLPSKVAWLPPTSEPGGRFAIQGICNLP
jgi:hypothetical protein